MKYIITGRTGTGKDTLRSMLAGAGLKMLKTHTDRERRFPGEDTYYFHTKEESSQIPKEQKLLLTVLDGDERFAMKEDLETAEVCILDPSGFYEICSLFPNEPIHLIYVTADANKARSVAGKRHGIPLKGMEVYDKRYADEDAQFTSFEKHIAFTCGESKQSMPDTDYTWPSNCEIIHRFNNPLDNLEAVRGFANTIMSHYKAVKNTISLVEGAVTLGCVNTEGSPDKIMLWRKKNGQDNVEYVTREMFADILLGDTEGMAAVMRAILQKTPIAIGKGVDS